MPLIVLSIFHVPVKSYSPHEGRPLRYYPHFTEEETVLLSKGLAQGHHVFDRKDQDLEAGGLALGPF